MSTEYPDHSLIIKRILNAPRQLVWDVWTQPAHIGKWWGPEGFSTRVEQMELKIGETWRYVMISPSGEEFPQEGIFQEIIEPKKLVSTADFGEESDSVNSTKVMTSLFDEIENKTLVTLIITYPTKEDRDRQEKLGVIYGWNANFDSFQNYLKNLTTN